VAYRVPATFILSGMKGGKTHALTSSHKYLSIIKPVVIIFEIYAAKERGRGK